MSNDPLFGPKLKVERADYHIAQLEEGFRAHIDTYIKPRMAQPDPDEEGGMIGCLDLNLPRHTATIVGDAIHNLRSSLDHAYWVMVEAAGGTFDRWVKFPFGKDRPSVEGAINGLPASAKPEKDVVDFIISDLQPFEGGCLHLYDLHLLNITDKHQLLLPQYARLHLYPGFRLMMYRGGPKPVYIQGAPGGTASIRVEDRRDPMFVNKAGPIKYEGDLHKAISIQFSEGPLEYRSVFPTLRLLSENVSGALKSLGAFL